jgi:large subunit ribosomal protein L23
MNDIRLFGVLRAPVISEKGTRVADAHRQYVFEVSTDATKEEIRRSVEKAFSVKVDSVRVANMPAKLKRSRGVRGSRQAWKKAYVHLQQGFDIDFTGQQK